MQSDRSQPTDRVSVTGEQRLLIRDAISAANPDEDGSLMRELDKRGVGDVVRRIEKSFPKGDFLCAACNQTTAYTETVIPFPDLAMQVLEEELAKTCHWWLSRRDIRELLQQCWRDCRNGIPESERANAE